MQEGIISFCRRQSVKQCWGQRMHEYMHTPAERSTGPRPCDPHTKQLYYSRVPPVDYKNTFAYLELLIGSSIHCLISS
jgi:hypothetical protein